MKETYEKIEINIQTITDEDIITTSSPFPPSPDPFKSRHENAYVGWDQLP